MSTSDPSQYVPPPSPTLDLEKFSQVTYMAANIAALAATDAGRGLALKLTGMLSDHVDSHFPQATKFNAAVAAARQANQEQMPAMIRQRDDKFHTIWDTMHILALKGDLNMGFLTAVPAMLQFPGSCPGCRNGYISYLKNHPPDLSTAQTAFKWTVDLHNVVNLKITPPKDLVTVEAALAIYAAKIAEQARAAEGA